MLGLRLIWETSIICCLPRFTFVEALKLVPRGSEMESESISKYLILKDLASSGTSRVYKVRDKDLDRVCVLKVLTDDSFDGGTGASPLDEARIACSMSHPNIATIFSLESYEEHTLLLQEWVEGETLEALIQKGPLTLLQTASIALALAETLNACHGYGVIHGDIKPSNVIIGEDNHPKLIDFGLSRQLEHRESDEQSRAGTLPYMAPERLISGKVDQRSDLFSLGVIIFQMITGHLPFRGKTIGEMSKSILNEDPPPLSVFARDVPLAWEKIVRKLLAHESDKRYANASRVIDDLNKLKSRPHPRSLPVGRHDDDSWMNGFRGLLAFEESESDLFFGRAFEANALAQLVGRSDERFLVLYGDSGCGKTSLLKAGLMPRLWKMGFLPLYLRAHGDPVAVIREKARAISSCTPLEDESSSEYLVRVADKMGGELVVIIDQFEESFLEGNFSHDRLFSLVQHSLSLEGITFLFSIRGDFLYRINEVFESAVDNPLASSRLYQLHHLNRTQAEEVIRETVAMRGKAMMPALLKEVLDDLETRGHIMASELQIVGWQLEKNRIHEPRDYRRSGGKQNLVYTYLEDVMNASGDFHSACLVLKSLVSDQNTRQSQSLTEVIRATGRNEKQMARILSLFRQSRFVDSFERDGEIRYELTHEYLIDKINTLGSNILTATQRANRLFETYLSQHSLDTSIRIPPTKIWFISRYADIVRGVREKELLRASSRRAISTLAAMLIITILAGTALAAYFGITVTWEVKRMREGHTRPVLDLAYSADGRLLASGGADGKLIVWDMAMDKMTPVRVLKGLDEKVYCLDFSPTDSLLAAFDGRRLMVWDSRTWEPVMTSSLEGKYDASANSLDFSPDGRLLTFANSQGMSVWDMHENREAFKYRCPTDEKKGLKKIAFSTDGKRIYSSDYTMWEVGTWQRFRLLDSHGSPGGNIIISLPDGKIITKGDNQLRYFEPGMSLYKNAKIEHKSWIIDAAWSPDWNRFATASEDASVVLWDAQTWEKITRFPFPSSVWSLAFSPDGKYLSVGVGDGSIHLIDMDTREPDINLSEHRAMVRAVAFSPDGGILASGGDDQAIILWDAVKRSKIRVLREHKSRILSLSFSSDGHWLVSTGGDYLILVWDVSNPGEAKIHSRHQDNGGIKQAVFHPTENTVFAFLHDKVFSWEFLSGSSKMGPISAMCRMSFSDQGDMFIAGGDFYNFALWNTENRNPLHTFPKEGDHTIYDLAFSPDDKWLVTGCDDQSIRLYNTETREKIAEIGEHTDAVYALAFSPDGRWLASGSRDKTVRLWDMARQRPAGTIGDHHFPIRSLDFSPDGRMLATGEQDHSVRIYTRRTTLWGFEIDR